LLGEWGLSAYPVTGSDAQKIVEVCNRTFCRTLVESQEKFLDLKAQYSRYKDEIMRAIADVCESQAFALGPAVRAFEEHMASYCDCKCAIGVSSGTDALLIGLMAMEIGPGDEVITTPFTFFATAGAIARLGARPVFVDVDPHSYNIDPAAIEQHICSGNLLK